MSRNTKNSFIALICAGVAFSVAGLGYGIDTGTTAAVHSDTTPGKPSPCWQMAEALNEQWQRSKQDPNWVEEEKEKHTIVPPADNSDLLKGEQQDGHTYGKFTEKDLLIWDRELEKFVVEGSLIFHNADLLGSTIAVSCDMCHPDASNTHPETYPKFQVQLGRVALLRDMINWCIEQAVRGEPLEADDPRMRALEAYILAQRKGAAMNYGKH
jgi:cytochrome c